ncbi:hypothetical protein OS176_02505 [Xanthomonadaceae bacterium XH05]|nr:hypothetical protein [Xanthomonadaceae bacterium XH05]
MISFDIQLAKDALAVSAGGNGGEQEFPLGFTEAGDLVLAVEGDARFPLACCWRDIKSGAVLSGGLGVAKSGEKAVLALIEEAGYPGVERLYLVLRGVLTELCLRKKMQEELVSMHVHLPDDFDLVDADKAWLGQMLLSTTRAGWRIGGKQVLTALGASLTVAAWGLECRFGDVSKEQKVIHDPEQTTDLLERFKHGGRLVGGGNGSGQSLGEAWFPAPLKEEILVRCAPYAAGKISLGLAWASNGWLTFKLYAESGRSPFFSFQRLVATTLIEDIGRMEQLAILTVNDYPGKEALRRYRYLSAWGADSSATPETAGASAGA